MINVNETLAKHVLIENDALVVDTKASKGSWLVTDDGKRYLDCFSQFASQPLGWNHPKIELQKDRLTEVALHKVANSDMSTIQYAEFVDTFSKFTPDFKYHFYISGGALAVENALKVAFDWKAHKLGLKSSNERLVKKLNVIHFNNAFHGRSGYTMSLTNKLGDNHKVKYFPKFNWPRVMSPAWHPSADEPKAINLVKAAISDIENNINEYTSAIILEPIQGEGGDNHFHQLLFTELRRIADENEVLLIFDEVQTGVGLTGKMWAYEHFGIVPDIISFGKKTQVCGICSTDRIDDVPENAFHTSSRINSTWGGNLVDMVRSTMFLEIIEEDNLIENAKDVGDYFLGKMKDLGLPGARGKGLMLAFDCQDSQERDEVLKRLSENMLALSCGNKSIRFRPHLDFTKDNVDVAIDFINKAI
ncbi:MAG: aminotransferase class III-fold pyridoxal phosphate-dependent enzyme [Candidatus Thorarchaeota archaeon]|jgi:L-lysine 6-transaminase